MKNETPPFLGAVLPMKEVGVKGLSEMAELAGQGALAFLLLYDHVILDHSSKPSSVENRLYTSEVPFLEPMVTAAWLSQIAKKSQLITGVLVAPQRQTVLLAQQAAHVSLFTDGRLELGLGAGWNPEEYKALGQNFHTRGKRLNEQITLIRKLWKEGEVTFHLDNELIERMAINPRPEKEIPIWVGGWSEKSIRRATEVADGWMPLDEPEKYALLKIFLLEQLQANKRDPEKFKIMGRVTLGTKSMKKCVEDYLQWVSLGVSHIVLSTTGTKNPDVSFHEHLIVDFWRQTSDFRHPTPSVGK